MASSLTTPYTSHICHLYTFALLRIALLVVKLHCPPGPLLAPIPCYTYTRHSTTTIHGRGGPGPGPQRPSGPGRPWAWAATMYMYHVPHAMSMSHVAPGTHHTPRCVCVASASASCACALRLRLFSTQPLATADRRPPTAGRRRRRRRSRRSRCSRCRSSSSRAFAQHRTQFAACSSLTQCISLWCI
jgi:hypothetical protein